MWASATHESAATLGGPRASGSARWTVQEQNVEVEEHQKEASPTSQVFLSHLL